MDYGDAMVASFESPFRKKWWTLETWLKERKKNFCEEIIFRIRKCVSTWLFHARGLISYSKNLFLPAYVCNNEFVTTYSESHLMGWEIILFVKNH